MNWLIDIFVYFIYIEFARIVHSVGGIGAAVRGRARQKRRLLQKRPGR